MAMAATIERIPPLIRSLVEAQDLTRFERAHFKGFGASALDFETVGARGEARATSPPSP